MVLFDNRRTYVIILGYDTKAIAPLVCYIALDGERSPEIRRGGNLKSSTFII